VVSLGDKMQGCRKTSEVLCEIPDPTLTLRGAEHRYAEPQFIFHVVQKQARKGRARLVIQSHYINY
jgi:hypothetical protein